jgi:Ca-activated chloride channel family protein
MWTRRFNLKQLAILTAAAFFMAASAAPQDSSDRPPWARKPKSKSTKTSTTTNPTPENTSPPEPINKDNRDSNSTDEPDQHGRIRVSVNLVNVLVSVLDDNNRPAPDLPVEAFQIFEEGVPQKIEFFESETKQPLDIALMIDASLSAHKEIAFEQQAAAHFIAQVLRPEDRLSVFAFDENVKQIPPGFSDNVKVLQSAVQKIPDGSGTSIYDALVLGSGALEHRKEERRRVIIMVTDGGETTSRLDFEAARKAAVRANTLLYSIIVRPVKNESGRNTAGEHAIETITDTTGGAIFFPDTAQDLDIIFDRIDRELRTQYRLGYYPNPRGPANTYRSIQVKVLDNYKVRHRKTYLTGPQ